MAPKKPYKHTPEQLALAEARRLKRERLAAQTTSAVPGSEPQSTIKPRDWLEVQSTAKREVDFCVKVFTWNLLAQCLVRRELFPSSDCLKSGTREGMLHDELLTQRADVLFLQEVDRLEKIEPLLTKAGYKHQYGAGPNKKHGCMIAYTSGFAQLDHRVIQYDNEDARVADTERTRRGSSFKTRNIGLLCALQSVRNPTQGIIAATTHLFWHPRYTYERARQAAILKREVNRFRADIGRPDWPCVVAGDFNFAPDDPVYSLLVGDTLLPEQEALISPSLVVHKSIDPTVPPTGPKVAEEGEDGESTDPDRVITDARSALEGDGLLSIPELLETFQSHAPWCSVYDDGLSRIKAQSPDIKTFGDRVNIPRTRKGAHEPEWTSYTHYWKTVLDYIFVQHPLERQLNIHGILVPFATEDLRPGLPRKGVSSSDHMSLCAEVSWSRQ
ncbi:RNA exonuclease ngl2 [Pleurotus ostreatus]|nr:RNA exonuclease ngl2 [Pleurotus ostreatus]